MLKDMLFLMGDIKKNVPLTCIVICFYFRNKK